VDERRTPNHGLGGRGMVAARNLWELKDHRLVGFPGEPDVIFSNGKLLSVRRSARASEDSGWKRNSGGVGPTRRVTSARRGHERSDRLTARVPQVGGLITGGAPSANWTGAGKVKVDRKERN
jgi:hypothetical protein